MDCRKCVNFKNTLKCSEYSGIEIKPDYPIKLHYFVSGCSGYYFDGRHCRSSKKDGDK